MRICAHLIKGVEKSCSLGISPVKCSGCSMFQLKSRRASQQPIMEMVNNSSAVKDMETQPISVSSASFGFEQNITQKAAVRGGCGCSKK